MKYLPLVLLFTGCFEQSISIGGYLGRCSLKDGLKLVEIQQLENDKIVTTYDSYRADRSESLYENRYKTVQDIRSADYIVEYCKEFDLLSRVTKLEYLVKELKK